MLGVCSSGSSGPYKITSGSLAGKNLVYGIWIRMITDSNTPTKKNYIDFRGFKSISSELDS